MLAADWSNPFCTRHIRPGVLPYFVENDAGKPQPFSESADRVEALVHRLVARRIGLIFGPHGSGKSTLLRTLEPTLRRHFPQVEWVSLQTAPERTIRSCWRNRILCRRTVVRALRGMRQDALLVVDGIEQLSRLDRYRLAWSIKRRSNFLLATAHEPIAAFQELWRTGLSPGTVAWLTDLLIQRQPTVVRLAVHDEMKKRLSDGVEDLRTLWFDLYDVAQEAAARRKQSGHSYSAVVGSADGGDRFSLAK